MLLRKYSKGKGPFYYLRCCRGGDAGRVRRSNGKDRGPTPHGWVLRIGKARKRVIMSDRSKAPTGGGRTGAGLRRPFGPITELPRPRALQLPPQSTPPVVHRGYSPSREEKSEDRRPMFSEDPSPLFLEDLSSESCRSATR